VYSKILAFQFSQTKQKHTALIKMRLLRKSFAFYTVNLFSDKQHGIKPSLEFSPNDRQIFRAPAEYLRISFVQNELRLISGNSVETGKTHGFAGLIFIRPNFVS
jgi:hypothetical protein